jgi:hypothetical protein
MALSAMNSPAAQKTSGLAITSLVLGIISLCCPVFLLPIAAVICGHIAQGQIKKSQGAIGGGGVALAGVILGYITIVLSIVAVVFWISVAPKMQSTIDLGVNIQNAQKIHMAMERMVSDGESKSDKALGWPADAGITTVAELKKRLVDNEFLTADEAASMNFDKFLFGNVSATDPASTVFIKFRDTFMGATVYLDKSGSQQTVETGDTLEEDPKRTPAYLEP